MQFDNVTFDTLSPSNFPSPNTLPNPYQAQITLGPGAVSTNLATPLISTNGINGNVITGSGSGTPVPPAFTFTFLISEIAGPTAQSQTVSLGQFPTAVVILSPAMATASASIHPYPTGTVTVTDELSHIFTATLPGTGDTIFIPITNAPLGTHTYTAAYSGDSVYAPITAANFGSTYSVTVISGSLASTGLGVTGVPANITFGTPITATAKLTGTGTPTGSISFLVNGAVYSTIPIVSKTASYTFNLPIGSYTVSAVYNGDSSNSASISTSSPVVVGGAATTIVLASSSTTSTVGVPVTLTATVTSGAGTPSGTVSFSYTSSTVTTPTTGDGCPATSILLQTGATAGDLSSVTVDPFGNTYFTDGSAALIRKLSTNGIVSNFAGRASNAPTACTPTVTPLKGCNPLAVSLSSKPRGVYNDPFGNIYIAGYGNNIVHVVRVSDGLMYLAAGTGTAATQAVNGDGGLATSAQLNQPRAITTDAAGNIYIASTGEDRVREVLNPNSRAAGAGTITTVVGSGNTTALIALTPDDVNAVTATNLTIPQGVAVDASTNIFVSTDTRVRTVCVTCSPGSALYSLLTILGYNHIVYGNIYTVAGTITSGSDPALTPGLGNAVNLSPQKIVVDPNGNLYIADSANNVVWFEDGRTGWTRVIAGGGNATSCTGSTVGDGCKATLGLLGSNGGNGIGVGLDLQGNLFVSDSTNLRIRKVSNDLRFGSSPVGTAVQQTIQVHYLPGDTPLATSLTSPDFSLAPPTSVLNATDTTTDCTYPATFKPAVAGLRLSPLAITTTLSNPGSFALTGSGTGAGATLDPANQITFGLNISPSALAVDNAGNVYVADSASKNVLKSSPGTTGTGGGSAATSTTLQSFMSPSAITVDAHLHGQHRKCVAWHTPTLEIVQVGNNAPFAVSLALGAFAPSPAFVGNTITLSATISSSSGVPPGTVIFSVDGTALAPSTVASGAASATVSGLVTGNHPVTAVFTSTDPNFANATATPATLTLQKNFVSALLAVQNASSIYNASNSATVTLTASAGTPAGTVQFSVDGVASGFACSGEFWRRHLCSPRTHCRFAHNHSLLLRRWNFSHGKRSRHCGHRVKSNSHSHLGRACLNHLRTA